MRPAQYLRYRTYTEFVRRRRGLKGESEGEEPPADPEEAGENPPGNEQKIEAVEPLEEPDPSARDEFHQAYTKKLEAADKDVEDYARTLDSVSYPVSARMPHRHPPLQSLHTGSSPLGPVIFRSCPPFRRLRIRTLFNPYVPWVDVILHTSFLTLRSLGFYGVSASIAVISLSLFAKQYLKHRSLKEHLRLSSTKKRGTLAGFTWLTEGGVPLVALAVLSPFLLSQVLSKTGQSLYATLNVVAATFFAIGFVLVWGPALLHTFITKAFQPRAPSRAPRLLPPAPLPKREVAPFSSAPGGEETQDSTAPLTVTPILSPVGVDYPGNLTDARRLTWMLERSSDPETIHTILRFILEVLWTPDHLQDADSSSSALVRSYELLWEAFDNDYATQPALLRGMRDQAFAAAKAFVHIFIQGDYSSDDPVTSTLRNLHIPLYSSSSLKDDANLRSVVGIVDNLLGVRKPIQWSELQLTQLHRLWLSNVLLYRAWYATKRGSRISDDVGGFVKHSLSSDPRPRLAVVTDCVLVVGLIVGQPLHEADLLVLEKT